MVNTFPFFRSDHSYVYLKFSLPHSIHRGPSMWKFNTAHLNDLSFIVLVTRFWETWRAEKRSFCTLSAWWDAGKARLHRLIKTFSRKKASAFHQRVILLERTLFFLKRRVDVGEDVDHLLCDMKAELEELLCQKASSSRLRANVQWAEEGEAPTTYFYHLERKHGQQRFFAAMKTLSGRVVRFVLLIAQAWVSFYVAVSFYVTQTLTPAERRMCEGELTLEECKLLSMAWLKGRLPVWMVF